jgi:hypothetical protein
MFYSKNIFLLPLYCLPGAAVPRADGLRSLQIAVAAQKLYLEPRPIQAG